MIQWNPENYHNNSSQQEKWAIEVLTGLTLHGNEKLLDIGSGDGKVTAAISKLLPYGTVTGIDSSKEMIQFASNKYPKQDYPNLGFKLMDMRELHFDKEFDIVFSAATLHWVTNHLTVLQQIKKCLRPSGRLILQMGGQGNQKELLQVLDNVINQSRWQNFFTGFEFQYGYYSKADYQGWLKTAGLITKRVDLIEKDNVQNGQAGLSSWICLAFSPYVQRIPEDLQVDLINEIAMQYLQTYPLDEQGMCHIKMVRLEVEAGCLVLVDN